MVASSAALDAQNVTLEALKGGVLNEGSIQANGLEDSQVTIASGEDVDNDGSIQAGKRVEIQAVDDVSNDGSIQAGTSDTAPFTPGSVISFEAGGDIESTGSLAAETILGLSQGDVNITGDVAAEALELHTTEVDGDITVDITSDLKSLTLVADGDQSDISFQGKDVDDLVAETNGQDGDIALAGEDIFVRRAVAQDGNVSLQGHNLEVGELAALENGEVNGADGAAHDATIIASGNVHLKKAVTADANVVIDAQGAITDGLSTLITSGEDTTLESGDHIGSPEDNNPISVDVGGKLTVNAKPGTPKINIFAFLEGTTGDGEVHTNSASMPGLVIFNSVPWMGTGKQMGRLDRAYAMMFSSMADMLMVFNLSNPLNSEYRYFPHTALDMDGYTNAPARGIEKIRMSGDRGGTIQGVPEGLTPNTIPSASDYEETFYWPLLDEEETPESTAEETVSNK